MKITEDKLRKLAADEVSIAVTDHARIRFEKRGIKIKDAVEALKHGEIIEQYPDDNPLPSCLVLHFVADGKPLHICAGVGDTDVWLITGYYPDNGKWENDFKTRKEQL